MRKTSQILLVKKFLEQYNRVQSSQKLRANMKRQNELIFDIFGPCAKLVFDLWDKQQQLEEKEKNANRFALAGISKGEFRAFTLEEKIQRNKARTAVKHAQDDYFETLVKLSDCVKNNC